MNQKLQVKVRVRVSANIVKAAKDALKKRNVPFVSVTGGGHTLWVTVPEDTGEYEDVREAIEDLVHIEIVEINEK